MVPNRWKIATRATFMLNLNYRCDVTLVLPFVYISCSTAPLYFAILPTHGNLGHTDLYRIHRLRHYILSTPRQTHSCDQPPVISQQYLTLQVYYNCSKKPASPHFAPSPITTTRSVTTSANVRKYVYVSYNTPRYNSQVFTTTRQNRIMLILQLEFNNRTTLL